VQRGGRRGGIEAGKQQDKVRATHTVPDITILDLLQHLGPNSRMALLVLVDTLCAKIQPLSDTPGSLIVL
jgi:hypothetical protein